MAICCLGGQKSQCTSVLDDNSILAFGKDETLIYATGHRSKQPALGDTKAGCAVIAQLKMNPPPADGRLFAFCVETYGPTNEIHPQTLDRVNLHAAIAVLE
jgi:hypothetical protein